MSPQAKSTVELKVFLTSSSSSPRRKNPKKAVQAMAQISTFLGFDEVSKILLIWASTGHVIGSLIVGGVLRSFAVLQHSWPAKASPLRQANNTSAVWSMQISLGLPDPREHSSLPIMKKVQVGTAVHDCWCSVTGNRFVTEYCTQNLWKFFSAAL